MRLQPNISKTVFHSFLFALGGAPTVAMSIILLRNIPTELQNTVFVSLTAIFACFLVPLILIQNLYLLFKRNNEYIEDHLSWLLKVYLGLNICCLLFWISYLLLH